MTRGRRGNTRRRPDNSTTISSVITRDVSNTFASAGAISFRPVAILETAARPTSARLMFSSSAPVWWQVRAYALVGANTTVTYESPKFTTCGNSIQRSFRSARNTPYGNATGTTISPLWSVTCSGAGMVVGTVTFSTRGPILPDEA